jgi:15-cis-phytoene synthase
MTVATAPSLADAYARCEEITRREARNFSYGIRLLRPPERQAMSALYAVARRIDDIGDGDGTRAEKLTALEQVHGDLDAITPGAGGGARLEAGTGTGTGTGTAETGTGTGNGNGTAETGTGTGNGNGNGTAETGTGTGNGNGTAETGTGTGNGNGTAETDPVLVALADTARRYPIPMVALHQLVDGCQMDVEGVTYRTFDDLVEYCRRVAGTVGRLSLGVYGCPDPAVAEPLADALGVALQITNILRDVVEDRDSMGRVYLPADDLARFGVGPDVRGSLDDVCALVTFEAGRAEDWYAEGLTLLPLLDRRSRACTAAMAGIYRRLLRRIQRDPAAVLAGRMSLPTREKATAAFRGLAWGTV